jgi:hypothetical protein
MKNKLAIEYSLNLRLFALKKISLYIEKKFWKISLQKLFQNIAIV